MSWIEEQEKKSLQQIRADIMQSQEWMEREVQKVRDLAHKQLSMTMCMYTEERVRYPDVTYKYYASIDPFECKLNWFQRQLQKVGFYKQGVSKVTIFKHNKDGTIEQITK